MAPEPRGPAEGRRLMRRAGLTLFAFLILVYWGIGLPFTFGFGLMNEAQAEQTVLNYLWELPVIGIPIAVAVPLLLLRPIARDYDRMLAGEPLPEPARSLDRLLAYPRRIVLIFTPASILAYLIGNVQSFYLQRLPVDEFWKGIPLGLPLGLLFSLASYVVLVHYLEPVRRLFVLRHGYDLLPRPKTSIYNKVVVTTVTVVALSLALLWLIAYAQGQHILEDQLHARMEEGTLPAAVEVALRRGEPRFEEDLARVRLGERGYAFIVDARGEVLTDHPKGYIHLAEEGWTVAQRSTILGAGKGQFADRVDIVRLVAFTQVPGTADHVVLVTYRDDFAAPLMEMTWGMLATTILGLAVASLLTLAGARAFTKPVRELTDAMRRARDDGTGGEVSLLTDDEVGGLAGSYARMMARLREKTRALEESVARMREMDAMKTRFMNIASHELRTPMTPIRTELHIIQSGRRGPLTEEQRKGLQMVARNVDRLNRLIRELLEASRMEAGQLRLQVARKDVAEVVAHVAGMMDAQAREKGITLVAEAPPGLWARLDEDRVHQVLINLLENALQFTPAGGRVTVRAWAEGAEVHVAVQDTGAGIDPAVIPRLFQPFSQAEPGVPRTEGGTGLGLFICRGIVEGHGGRIGCASEGKGKGATFQFTLPLAPEGVEPAPGAAGAEAPALRPRLPP